MIEQTVRHVYSLLCDEKYEELVVLTKNRRLSRFDIECCIAEYSCKLRPYPEEIKLDIVYVDNTSPQKWSVIAPIYTDEEDLSDLSIELSLTKTESGLYKTELDNIRVR